MNDKGGLAKGKSHAEGGIKATVKSTGQNIEFEGGEIIVNKRNVADKTLLEFEGEKKTTCEILSDLNSRNNNGVTIDCDTVEGKKYKYAEGGKLTDDDIYVIEHSHNGTIKEIDDQFKTAKFNTVKDAREFVKDLIRYEKVYGYDFEDGSYFQIQKVIEEGEEYENIGNKINYKEHKYFSEGGEVDYYDYYEESDFDIDLNEIDISNLTKISETSDLEHWIDKDEYYNEGELSIFYIHKPTKKGSWWYNTDWINYEYEIGNLKIHDELVNDFLDKKEYSEGGEVSDARNRFFKRITEAEKEIKNSKLEYSKYAKILKEYKDLLKKNQHIHPTDARFELLFLARENFLKSLPNNGSGLSWDEEEDLFKDYSDVYSKLKNNKPFAKSFEKGGSINSDDVDYDTFKRNKRNQLFAQNGVKIPEILTLENTLDIDRANMPQIREHYMDAFLEQLEEDDINYSYELVDANTLKPTQVHINLDKVSALTPEYVDSRYLVVSNDNYLLDGHHRWYFSVDNNRNAKVLKIDLPIMELIDYANDFDQTEYSGINKPAEFKKGGKVSNKDLVGEVIEKLVPNQQKLFLKEVDDPSDVGDMLTNVINAYKDIPKLYSQDGKKQNAVAYLHYFTPTLDYYITEYSKDNVYAYGFTVGEIDGGLDIGQGQINLDFLKNPNNYSETPISPLSEPQLDFYFTYGTINEILEKKYPELVKPPVERYESPKPKAASEPTLITTDWQKLINDNSFANPYEKVLAIEKMLDEKGEDPNNYSTTEKKFISEYTGIGGMESKYGAKRRDVGFGKDFDYGLLYEFFTPAKLCQIMWGLAYKNSGGMSFKDVLEPSMGAGAFINQAPLNVNIDGYDINKYCYMINKILHTDKRFNFYHDSFESLFISRNQSVKGDVTPMYDLVIGNPPYGKYQGYYAVLGNKDSEKNYTKANDFIDYFISRGLDLLRPNGLLVYVIGWLPVFGSVSFLDKKMSPSKSRILAKSELVDAYRLGNSMFEFTNVDADIIVLRKK